MAISALTPIEPAFGRMWRMLFRPFNFTKWLTLGFCAWLAQLAQGGFRINLPGGNFTAPGPGGAGAGDDDLVQWIIANLYWLIPLIVSIALVVIALTLVLLWLRSRGKFMFLAGVARNDVAVAGYWKEFRRLGNSLFVFQAIFTFVSMLMLLLVAGLGLLIAMPDIQAGHFGGYAIGAIATGALLFIAGVLLFTLIHLIVDNFIVPLMYLREQAILPAWNEFRTSLLPGHLGVFLLYFLMLIVLGGVASVVVLIGTLLTCCLAGLPYINAVVFLPISVFFRSYSLYFLEQFGSGYQMMVLMADQQRGFPVVLSPLPPPPLDRPL